MRKRLTRNTPPRDVPIQADLDGAQAALNDARGLKNRIGEAGSALSAGQRQRVALARALYGDPFLLILDEPNSNLDADGVSALTGRFRAFEPPHRRRGGASAKRAGKRRQVLVMANGRVQAFGPKNEVLNKVTRPSGVPLDVVPVPEENVS